jgi:hypothetical protein
MLNKKNKNFSENCALSAFSSQLCGFFDQLVYSAILCFKWLLFTCPTKLILDVEC